jgi:hypothetical protein
MITHIFNFFNKSIIYMLFNFFSAISPFFFINIGRMIIFSFTFNDK